MPHFTLDISPQGLLLTAWIGVSQARAKALTDANQPVPKPVTVRGLLDTGASITCVDPSVLDSLQLTPKGVVPLYTASTGDEPRNADQYDVSLWVPGASQSHPPLSFGTLGVAAIETVAKLGFQALIGRDVLAQCVLFYNGGMGFFTVCY
jgi:hypothetical protein